MSSTSTFAVFSILILSVVAHLGNPGNHPRRSTPSGCPPGSSESSTTSPSPLTSDPAFLNQVSPQARRQYNDIVNNDSLTPTQTEQQLAKWAQSNGVVNELRQYQQEQKTFLDNLNMNIRMLAGNIPNVLDQMIRIIENKNQTGEMEKRAIERLSRQYPQETTALFIMLTMTVDKILLQQSDMSITPRVTSGSTRTTPSWSRPTSQPWNWPRQSTPRFPQFSPRPF